MSKDEGAMKSDELPKIRATRKQIDALLKSVNKDIDAAADKEDPNGLGRTRAKNLFSDSMLRHVDLIEKPDLNMIGEPGKLMRVEIHGDQGSGKTRVGDLLAIIDSSVRHENLEFTMALDGLCSFIEDYGLTHFLQASNESVTVPVKPGYEGLFGILAEALARAQQGKGNERHNPTGAVPFEEQRMQTISRMIGSVKGMEYQAIKKLTEGLDMPELDRQVKELLGVINYVAGIIIFLRTKAGVLPGDTNA